MTTHQEVRKKYIRFFASGDRKHKEIPSAPLVPENDPTTLFTSSGMQPLVPYLLGEPHPLGTRLVNSQKSFRAQDIEEVGDNRHTTFFEMLGNWSLGDYFKKEQLPWFFTFLTKELGLDPQRLYVTVFEGNAEVPKDTESIELWKTIFSGAGIRAEVGKRIFTYPANKNWWSRSGPPENMPPGEPGGPDSEVFFEFTHIPHDPRFGPSCHPNCDCGRFMEIGNSVFMQYQKKPDGTLKELPKKNVDFGGGLERLVAAVHNNPDVFQTSIFTPLIRELEKQAKTSYGSSPAVTKAMRIIADHTRAAVMMMADGVVPSNKTQGYVLRRLLRRSMRYAQTVSLTDAFLPELAHHVFSLYEDAYPVSRDRQEAILHEIRTEEQKFHQMLTKGLREIEKIKTLTGTAAFQLYETFGFPWEMTEEIARERGQNVEKGEFEAEFKKHQAQSRTAARGMFRGGLADHSEQVIHLHTATHLLQQALRDVLGDTVRQKGSNITAERLRFDFSYLRKLTADEIVQVEKQVNKQITANLPVSMVMVPLEKAKKTALYVEGAQFPETVNVYSIGDYSREICGGPHVDFTGRLGRFKIIKEEAAGNQIRRIYAALT